MGRDRSINSHDEEAQVQRTIAKELDIKTIDLYELWKDYVLYKLSGEKNIVGLLRSSEKIYNSKALDYFATIGLELFMSEIFKG